MGSGKSTTARRYASHAYCIDADRIQYDAVRRAFPYIKNSRVYSRHAWPRDISTMHVHSLLHISLESVAHRIRDYSGHLIIEGGILSSDWFRESLQAVLLDFGHEFADSEVKLLHLDTPARVVYEHIHERAEKIEGRRKEKERFPDVQAVRKHNEGYSKSFTKGLWTICTSNDALDEAITSFFGV